MIIHKIALKSTLWINMVQIKDFGLELTCQVGRVSRETGVHLGREAGTVAGTAAGAEALREPTTTKPCESKTCWPWRRRPYSK